MAHLPFFHTWTKQNQAKKIDIDKTFEWGYLTPEGKKIYDLSSGSYHQSFGIRNKQIEDAMIEQIQSMPMAIPKCQYRLKNSVSQKLLNVIGIEGRIFYTTSGAESNENAIKMARQITGRQFILSCETSYHGATLGALALTGDWRRDGAGIPSNFHAFIPNFFNDPDLVKTREIINKIGSTNIAAICLEVITGGNGVFIPPQSYYDEISKLCQETGIKLILDEVVCGFGRTSTNFGFQNFNNLRPDFITLAKNISGGFFPFGAVFVSENNASFFDDNTLSCGLTNAGHPIGLRILDEVLTIIKDENFIKTREENFQLLETFKHKIDNSKSISAVRHIGLLMAIDLNDNIIEANQLWNKLIDNGLFINITKRSLILCPYLNYSPLELENCLDKLLNIIEDSHVQ
ncbi:aminotransferase, class III [Bacteriovorax sp. BAL6_X]|uniref:aminotransferase class III-fold pyridoxal phosphate-dependent enzyme n=1 Tax=Bacteriovorax sp. BAL6_X TaxID=1201290 RepID=UPI000386BEFF|nr:aminotransferase class III-fold pyridoxal phosphate-dependent enzyme [Bacteriovorax sp. BAL6_X]EPZ50735.1 aminotransferase, class III [Bacteriovorax sp. BAL6_X]